MWRRGYYSISPVMMTKKPSPPTAQVPNKKDFDNVKFLNTDNYEDNEH